MKTCADVLGADVLGADPLGADPLGADLRYPDAQRVSGACGSLVV